MGSAPSTGFPCPGFRIRRRRSVRAAPRGRQHLGAGLDHHRRPAEVVFHGPGAVAAEVVFEDDFVDEAAWPPQCPRAVGRRERDGRRSWVTGCELVEIVLVEDLLPRSRAIPETHLASRVLGLEEVGDMRPERRHAGAAADVDHLPLRRLDVEIAEGPDGGDGVAGLQAEDVGGADAGRAVLAGWRRRDADVETQLALQVPVAGQRIVVATAGVVRATRSKTCWVPRRTRTARVYRIRGSGLLVGGDVELEVVARREDGVPAVRRSQDKFLDERGDVSLLTTRNRKSSGGGCRSRRRATLRWMRPLCSSSG